MPAATNKSDANAESKPDAPEQKAKKAYLTEEMVKRVFALDASVKFEPYDIIKDRNKPKPAYSFGTPLSSMPNTVKFVFPKPNRDEVEKRNNERMSKASATNLREMLSASESLDIEAYLSFFDEAPSAALAKGRFDEAGRMLRGGTKGMSDEDIEKRIEEERKKGTNAASLKMIREALKGSATKLSGDAAIEPIEGLGDAAEWSVKHRLLRVLRGKQLFSITVDYKPEENKTKAIELAREVLKTL
ncbi:MAG: hypothetical protein HY22_00545 [[Candidatus Thermochlorobacteriaceae] bacterium GBChlB]|nr:MAG: hypothetical protein HY22_00545 [[Candidatus Thermochlorobacteriaceae] bacterium GBChlB]